MEPQLTAPRLIDANALKEAIRNIEFHCGDSFDDAIADAVDAIESAHNVDIISEETNGAIWLYAEENDVSKWIIHGILKIIQTPFNE